MKPTEKNLLEQLNISDFENKYRKSIFSLSEIDITYLKAAKPVIMNHIDFIVKKFYQILNQIPEITMLIGDSDTFARIHISQRKYIIDLFSGLYDLEYVNNRLRIGMVHKRIGVEPKLYLCAISTLKTIINELLSKEIPDSFNRIPTLHAIEKLLFFDISLVFDTYIRSMLAEIENSKEKIENYASSLEKTIQERTEQLTILSKTDALTGLLNVRHLSDNLLSILRAAQRRSEPVSIVFMDINNFKIINDFKGHEAGNDLLRILGKCILNVSRKEDQCYRYGGDEICIILPNCTKESAHSIYEKRLIKEVHNNTHILSLSIGIVQTGPDKYMEPEELIHTVDQQMYLAKQESKKAKITKNSKIVSS